MAKRSKRRVRQRSKAHIGRVKRGRKRRLRSRARSKVARTSRKK